MNYSYEIQTPDGDSIRSFDVIALQNWIMNRDASGYLALNLVSDPAIADRTWEGLTRELRERTGIIVTREALPLNT